MVASHVARARGGADPIPSPSFASPITDAPPGPPRLFAARPPAQAVAWPACGPSSLGASPPNAITASLVAIKATVAALARPPGQRGKARNSLWRPSPRATVRTTSQGWWLCACCCVRSTRQHGEGDEECGKRMGLALDLAPRKLWLPPRVRQKVLCGHRTELLRPPLFVLCAARAAADPRHLLCADERGRVAYAHAPAVK